MNQLNDSQIVVRLPKGLKDLTEYYKDVLEITTSQFIRDAITKEIELQKDKTINE